MYTVHKGFGKPWDKEFEQVMSFYTSTLDARWGVTDENVIINESARFLSYGETGKRLYDILLLLVIGKGAHTDKVVALIKSFCSEIKVYDFILDSRNLLRDEWLHDNSSFSNVMSIGALILTGYGFGVLAGVDSPNKQAVFSADGVDPYYYLLGLYLEFNTPERTKKRSLAKGIKIPPKKRERLAKFFRKYDKHGIGSALRVATPENMQFLVNELISSTVYSYFYSVYNEMSKDYFIPHDAIYYANWGRDVTDEGMTSNFLVMFNEYFTGAFCDKDVYKHRNIYVRDKGVKIRFKEAYDNISTISLREYHSDSLYEEHYMLITYTLEKEGISRFLAIDMTSLSRSYLTVQYEKDAVVLLLVMLWLGLVDKLDLSLENHLRVYADKENTRKQIEWLKGYGDEVITKFADAVKEDKIIYETPTHWNYDAAKGSKSSGKPDPVYARERRTIGRYSRRLPAGQKTSKEAKEAARKVFFALEEGYTFVDEFDRGQRVRLN